MDRVWEGSRKHERIHASERLPRQNVRRWDSKSAQQLMKILRRIEARTRGGWLGTPTHSCPVVHAYLSHRGYLW